MESSFKRTPIAALLAMQRTFPFDGTTPTSIFSLTSDLSSLAERFGSIDILKKKILGMQLHLWLHSSVALLTVAKFPNLNI